MSAPTPPPSAPRMTLRPPPSPPNRAVLQGRRYSRRSRHVRPTHRLRRCPQRAWPYGRGYPPPSPQGRLTFTVVYVAVVVAAFVVAPSSLHISAILDCRADGHSFKPSDGTGWKRPAGCGDTVFPEMGVTLPGHVPPSLPLEPVKWSSHRAHYRPVAAPPQSGMRGSRATAATQKGDSRPAGVRGGAAAGTRRGMRRSGGSGVGRGCPRGCREVMTESHTLAACSSSTPPPSQIVGWPGSFENE